MTRVTERLSATTGWTEGQVQTIALTSVLAIVLTVFGIGPALNGAPATTAAAASPAEVAAVPPPAPAPELSAPLAPPPGELVPAASAPLSAVFDTSPPAPVFPEPAPRDNPSSSPPAAAAAPPPAAAGPDPEAGLSIATSAWYADDAGTPLAQIDNPVPENGLPVAARGTRASRFSVIRLEGAPTATTLQLATTANGQFQPDRAGVLMCPLLNEMWKPGPAQPMSAAPPYSADDCVAGVAGQSAYTFPLSAFSVRAGGAGFALVPVSDPARPLFQVTFSDGGTA